MASINAVASASSASATTELFNFPPLYTLQPVQETRQKQLEIWCKLIKDWAAETNTWAAIPSKIPLWTNPTIQRTLSPAGVAAVVSKLLGEGFATWEQPEDAATFASNPQETVATTTGRLRLTWRTASEVAVDLWAHARAAGMLGAVFTIYELHSGDVAIGTPFENMDPWLIREAIGCLEAQGKAALFPGASLEEEGVKFSDA